MARDRASRPEAKAQRLFVAVEIPQEVREALAEAVAPLREQLPGARWVPVANQHLTLQFLGATWPRLVPWVGEQVAGVAARHAPFEVAIDGSGTFPNDRRPRILWAAVVDPHGRLGAIARDLDSSLARELKAEEREFTPHLTLARLDGKTPTTEALAAATVPSLRFDVGHLTLLRSHLRRPTPVYEPLLEVDLTGSA